jgi:hypothetical protein
VARAVAVRLSEPAPSIAPADYAPGRLRRWAAHRAAPFVVAVVVAIVVAAGAPMRATSRARTTADEPHYLLSALSLWEDHDLDVSDERAALRYHDFHAATLPVQAEIQPDGSQIEPHDPLLPVLLAAPVGLGGWLGAKLFMAALAGVLAGLTMVAANRRFGVSPVVALVAALLVGLSPPLAIYGTQIYPELPAALLTLAGFWWVTGRLATRAVWGAALAVVALPWLSMKYAPVAGVLAIALLWRLWRDGRGAWVRRVGTGLSLAAVVFALGHFWIYGGWTAYASGSHFAAGDFSVVGDRPDYVGRSQRVVGLLVDRSFGLAVWQPAAFALVPATAVMLRRRPAAGRLVLVLLATGWLMATYVALTMQGWWWPGRQVVVVVPLAVVAIAWWVERLGVVGRRLALGAGTLGVVAYVFLLAGVLGGRHTLIVDFDRTLDPVVRGAQYLLPDGLVQNAGTWWRLAAWAAGLATLGVWAAQRQAV